MWLFRQGQLIVIIYEVWSRSITADWKSLPVCVGWGWVGSVNPGTTVPHLLAIHFDQLNKTLCVRLCETSSVNRLVWKRTHCSVAFSTCMHTTGVKRPHVVKQKSVYALGWWHRDNIVNMYTKGKQDRGKSVCEWTRDTKIQLFRCCIHVKGFCVNQHFPLARVWAIMFLLRTGENVWGNATFQKTSAHYLVFLLSNVWSGCTKGCGTYFIRPRSWDPAFGILMDPSCAALSGTNLVW